MMWEPPVGQGYPRPVRFVRSQGNRVLIRLEEPVPSKQRRKAADVRWVYVEALKPVPG